MPGIIGFTVNNLTKDMSLKCLAKMQNLITHQNFYIKDNLFYDESICATRSHTNIIQKQAQPFYETGIFVWLDGEFYNQEEIDIDSKTLSISDPSLLASLYKKYGDFSFLKGINGIYSAVIYDSVLKKIHLITDRYGLRHLYWTVHKGCLAWGSEVKSMLALPDFKPEINLQSVEDFFSFGHLLEDRTWFKGVELLSPGSILTWDIHEKSIHEQHYWCWDEIKLLADKINENEIVEELGELFVSAVRCRTKDRTVGITLSGGLDSRAILAAISSDLDPIHSVTFGTKNCNDICIAKTVAEKRGSIHHIVHINQQNWLQNRIEGIWWTDGQLNIQHMHGSYAVAKARKNFLINVNGFLGDALLGGSYYPVKNFDNVFHKVDNRGRRFINEGTRASNIYLENRIPFFDNRLMEFTLSIPEELRTNSYIYNKMLLRKFPSYFKHIPWQKTGYPISYSEPVIKMLNLPRRVINKSLSQLNIKNHNYVNYSNWIRREPAKSFFETILCSKSAIYPLYISRDNVYQCLSMHQNKSQECTEFLCLALTFEVWLQQVFAFKQTS